MIFHVKKNGVETEEDVCVNGLDIWLKDLDFCL
jgi:hypothetical protein